MSSIIFTSNPPRRQSSSVSSTQSVSNVPLQYRQSSSTSQASLSMRRQSSPFPSCVSMNMPRSLPQRPPTIHPPSYGSINGFDGPYRPGLDVRLSSYTPSSFHSNSQTTEYTLSPEAPPFRSVVTREPPPPPMRQPIFTPIMSRLPYTAAGNRLANPPMAGMTSTFPEDTSAEKRSRQGRHRTACDRCRGRKSRCDQEEPCATCIKGRVGSTCAYSKDLEPSWSTDGVFRAPREQRRKRPKHDSQEKTVGQNNAAAYEGRESDGGEERLLVGPESISNSLELHTAPYEYAAILGGSTHEPPMRNRSGSSPMLTTLPVSSERNNPIYHTPSSPSTGNSYWENGRTSAGRLSPDPQTDDGSSSDGWSENELMEEDECRNVGSRRYNQGPRPDNEESEKVFYGTSHFGPQMAARIASGKGAGPPMSLNDVRHCPSRGVTQIDDTKPYTLVSQIRDLVALLPRREASDLYVQSYFEKYNDYIDIIYRPDFDIAYNNFWNNNLDVSKIDQVDLRQLALILMVIAFGVLLDYDPNAGKERSQVVEDLRLAGREERTIRAMMDELEANTLALQDREELSLKWSWGAKRALIEASCFYSESIDTIALFMITSRRVPEGWTAIGGAIRAAEAQGMHVDGASWTGMAPVEVELRRRLWAQLYTIDRSVSLFLGRPLAIQDKEFTAHEPLNVSDHELGNLNITPRPFYYPTKSTFLILHFRLARIIGQLQLTCFGLHSRSYDDVQACERLFADYRKALPMHFDLANPDTSLDDQEEFRWLKTQRQTLVSKYHLARISLHRPYLLHSFGKRSNKQYRLSREACLFSSIADLNLRTSLTDADPLDRFKWMTVASGFNPATIIGILCIYKYHDERLDNDHLLNLLEKYIRAEKTTVRRDEALSDELCVLDLMVEKAKMRREKPRRRIDNRDQRVPSPSPAIAPVDYFDLFPPIWENQAEPMPEPSDYDGWSHIINQVGSMEESPESQMARMPDVSASCHF